MTENKPEQFELPMPATDPREGWTSASNARADGLCVGRHYAQRGLPDLPRDEDDDASSGTKVHNALATRNPVALQENEHKTYDLCLEVEQVAVSQFFGTESDDLMTVAEERYWVVIDGTLKHSAQVDRVYRSKSKALIVEYKTLPGDHQVASSNEQARDGVCLVHGNLLVNLIGVVVIQPMITMKPEICTYNADQIKVATALMFDRVRASNALGGKRTAGDVQCKWCRAKHQCLEYEQFAAGQLPAMTTFVDSPVATWTPEQCGVFLERLDVANRWLKECKEAIRRRIEAGQLPGWKIGEGDRMSKVTDMLQLHQRCKALGIPDEEFLQLCSPNKESLTKLVRKATSTKGKGLLSEMDKLLEGICTEDRKKGSIERVQ